jgi:hypothetical protein
MAAPVETFPNKQQGVSLDNPLEFLPLTKANIRQNLPRLLRQLFSYDLQRQKKYETLAHALYTPQAQFQYPGAALYGADNIIQFWNGFLIGTVRSVNACVWLTCCNPK